MSERRRNQTIASEMNVGADEVALIAATLAGTVTKRDLFNVERRVDSNGMTEGDREAFGTDDAGIAAFKAATQSDMG